LRLVQQMANTARPRAIRVWSPKRSIAEAPCLRVRGASQSSTSQPPLTQDARQCTCLAWRQAGQSRSGASFVKKRKRAGGSADSSLLHSGQTTSANLRSSRSGCSSAGRAADWCSGRDWCHSHFRGCVLEQSRKLRGLSRWCLRLWNSSAGRAGCCRCGRDWFRSLSPDYGRVPRPRRLDCLCQTQHRNRSARVRKSTLQFRSPSSAPATSACVNACSSPLGIWFARWISASSSQHQLIDNVPWAYPKSAMLRVY
jgi:hypothetical protein